MRAHAHLFTQTHLHTCRVGHGICAGDPCDSGLRDDEQTDREESGLSEGEVILMCSQQMWLHHNRAEQVHYLSDRYTHWNIHTHTRCISRRSKLKQKQIYLCLIKVLLFALVHLSAARLGHSLPTTQPHSNICRKTEMAPSEILFFYWSIS